ncbi:hypothetical protein ANN_09293 [Periplaneta americana]|uniref:Uncharacterized protein n=1 Tax=Periplaneta americana TaxID=6978 RepID=A0ABQ8TNU6_PERAM|nr:hypothetical protein ANN_09293 [Periplaneta americana]
MADTSNYSLVERLVASVWVRERQHTGKTKPKIMTQFERRFERPLPRKSTLSAWEKRAFITGKPVAARPYRTNDELKDAVTAAFADITPQQLRKMSQRTWRHIQFCIDNDTARTRHS